MGFDDLSNKPQPLFLEVNEWRSLPPGSYRVHVVGFRVAIPSDDQSPFSAPAVPIVSNDVSFDVVEAGKVWQARELATAEATLDAATSGSDEERHAARTLRFLGTEDATREMARRYGMGTNVEQEFELGLFSSPYRALAIQSMQNAMADPSHPVSRMYIDSLITLQLESDLRFAFPVTYATVTDPTVIARINARDAERVKRRAILTNQAIASLGSKTPSARAETAVDLLTSGEPLKGETRDRVVEQLISVWDALSAQRQAPVFSAYWESVASPAWLPILRSIADGSPNLNQDGVKLDRGNALERIYELAPTDGRNRILREIAHPQGDVGFDVLARLPDRELPQLDRDLVEGLKSDRTSYLDRQLIARYASAGAFLPVRAFYESRSSQGFDCGDVSLLRYFLRVKPDFGIPLTKAALISSAALPGCFRVFSRSKGRRTPPADRAAGYCSHEPQRGYRGNRSRCSSQQVRLARSGVRAVGTPRTVESARAKRGCRLRC